MRFGRNPWPRSAKITTGVLGALLVFQGIMIGSGPLPDEGETTSAVADVTTETVTETATEVRTELPEGFEERQDRLTVLQSSLRTRDRKLDDRADKLDKKAKRLNTRADRLDARADDIAQQAAVAAAPAAPASVYYDNCSEAEAAGDTPLYAGDQGYASHLDGDGDGVACE